MRLVRPFYTLGFILLAIAYGINNNRIERMDWLMLPPIALLVWTAWRHIRLRFITLTIEGNRLRYETGLFSRATRAMELSRIQDVRVNQTFLQRILGLGTVSIETAGETGYISIANVDNPHGVADYILETSRK